MLDASQVVVVLKEHEHETIEGYCVDVSSYLRPISVANCLNAPESYFQESTSSFSSALADAELDEAAK